MTTIAGALLEVAIFLRHLVGDMGKTDHCCSLRFGKGIKRRRFHLDSEDAKVVGVLNGGFGFAKRGVGRPGCASVDGQGGCLQAGCNRFLQT